MGKKDKKKKVSGSEKTQKKTEKKLNAKMKKELAAIGEVIKFLLKKLKLRNT